MQDREKKDEKISYHKSRIDSYSDLYEDLCCFNKCVKGAKQQNNSLYSFSIHNIKIPQICEHEHLWEDNAR